MAVDECRIVVGPWPKAVPSKEGYWTRDGVCCGIFLVSLTPFSTTIARLLSDLVQTRLSSRSLASEVYLQGTVPKQIRDRCGSLPQNSRSPHANLATRSMAVRTPSQLRHAIPDIFSSARTVIWLVSSCVYTLPSLKSTPQPTL